MTSFTFEPIGYINSCFKEKFGIPRQPGLVSEAMAILQIVPPFNQPEAFRDLDRFSHIWILFVFHKSLSHRWRSTVRPPRLGGNRRVGVFASRSGFRPNTIGQSAVELQSINTTEGKIELTLGGVDLLQGTPVLDIKPYIPYADTVPAVRCGYADHPPKACWPVLFTPKAAQVCKKMEQARHPGLRNFITQLLAFDPRPGYQQHKPSHVYGMRLYDLNIKFRFASDHIEIDAIETS